MTLATPIAKQVIYKEETTFGVAAGASSAQRLRRVESTLDLVKDTYQSQEKRSDYQIADFRHGVRRVAGNIKGELSAGTYKDFMAAALRKAFTAKSDLTSLDLTIAASGTVWTIERDAGSWLTDEVKIGDVIRLSVGTLNIANASKNLVIIAAAADLITVVPLNGEALVAEGIITGCTVSFPGKKTLAPLTGHTNKSFSIEHFYSDILQSELFKGCKVNTMNIELPSTGMAMVDFGMMGQNVQEATSAYFTSPADETGTGTLAAVNGILVANGAPIAICTGLSLAINGGYGADPVVGSNQLPELFPGPISVSGQFSAYFEDAALRSAFWNETEISLIGAFTADESGTADFISFVLPRIKVGGASKNDADKGIVATYPFTGLLNTSGGTGISSDRTTLAIQDSQA